MCSVTFQYDELQKTSSSSAMRHRFVYDKSAFPFSSNPNGSASAIMAHASAACFDGHGFSERRVQLRVS